MNKLRSHTAAQTTTTLLDVVETLEDKTDRTEAERITYAVAAATLAKRLNLDPRTVAASKIGPAAYFRLVAA